MAQYIKDFFSPVYSDLRISENGSYARLDEIIGKIEKLKKYKITIENSLRRMPAGEEAAMDDRRKMLLIALSRIETMLVEFNTATQREEQGQTVSSVYKELLFKYDEDFYKIAGTIIIDG